MTRPDPDHPRPIDPRVTEEDLRKGLKSIRGVRHEWNDHGRLMGQQTSPIERIDYATMTRARMVNRLLPNAISAVQPKIRTKVVRAICTDCGESGKWVDPDLKLCTDRAACERRARDWR